MGSSEGKSNLLRGAFVSEEIKDSIPVFSTPVRLPPRQAWFTNINCITLKYRTNGTSVRGLIPDNLTIEKEPLVTSMLLDYGMSNFGQYHELIYFLEGVHQAQKYDYGIVLYLDNEDAVYGGREGFGYPKILAKLDVQFRPECMKAYMRDRVERPTDMPILDIMFKPSLLLEEFEVPETTKHHLNLRVILTVAEQIQGARFRNRTERGFKPTNTTSRFVLGSHSTRRPVEAAKNCPRLQTGPTRWTISTRT